MIDCVVTITTIFIYCFFVTYQFLLKCCWSSCCCFFLQEGRSLWYFSVTFYSSVDYRKCVFEGNSHKGTRNYDSSSHVGQPGLWSSGPNSRLFLTVYFPRLLSLPCRLHSPAESLLLFTSVDWSLLFSLGSSFHRLIPVSWEISRASPLCGFHAKTDKRILWLAPASTETNATQCITLFLLLFTHIVR